MLSKNEIELENIKNKINDIDSEEISNFEKKIKYIKKVNKKIFKLFNKKIQIIYFIY